MERRATSRQRGPLSVAPFLLATLLCNVSAHNPSISIPPQPSHFEIQMRRILKVDDHSALQEAIHSAATKVQGKAEAVALSGEGESHYLEWKLGMPVRGASYESRRRRLEVLSSNTSTTSAILSPGLSSTPTEADMNMTIIRFGSVSYPSLVDWRAVSAVNTAVVDQRSCESCWVMAVTDIISMSWSLISHFLEPVPLSPQHVCDCGFPKCCSGGWPDWTMQFTKVNKGLASWDAYPYLGKDGLKCQAANKSLTGRITGWEKVPANTKQGLIKTVAQHPVVVLIYASPSFMAYTGGIFRGTDCKTKKSVNHALVVMGYNASVSDPYWIAKNSWGTGWGEGGYIRISMTGSVCQFGSQPSLYPTLYRVATPCDATPNPCGAGTCYLMGDGVTARCQCPTGFVERLEDSAPKCVTLDACSSGVNPCAFGACINRFDGSYSCSCPAGTVIGSSTGGGESCIVNSFQSGLKTYTTLPGDDCQSVMSIFTLNTQVFLTMNPFLNCSEPITPGTIVVVEGAESGTGCSTTDVVRSNDTCALVAARNNISVTQLVNINKGLNCLGNGNDNIRLSQHLCVVPGELAVSSPYERSCGRAEFVEDSTSCLTVVQNYNLSLSVFQWLNPGLDCTQLLPAAFVCVAPLLLGATTVTCNSYYNLTQSDTCFTVAQGADLDMADFLAINPGLKCTGPSWNVGRTVCINGSAVALSQMEVSPNMIPYYVKTNDTLASFAATFMPQCDNAGSFLNDTARAQFITDICWANSWIPDCSDRRVILGSMVLIPCVRDIGATSCSSTDISMAVCGNNYVSYVTYSCASVQFATPPSKYALCQSCDQYCLGYAGLTLSQAYGCTPPGCGDRLCSYPTLPSAAYASQYCSGTNQLCQLRQWQCGSATANTLGSKGCAVYKDCYQNNPAGCIKTVSNPCGKANPMASCVF